MKATIIDSHAHIYLDEFNDDREEVLARAKTAGVEKIFMPNIDQASVAPMLDLAKAYPEVCYPMIGLHPCSVDDTWERQLETLMPFLDQVAPIAVGEIGVDLHWDVTFKEQQIEAFRVQTGWALVRNLPIVIHSRKSIDLILDLLEEWNLSGLRGVFHCFGGTRGQASRIQDLGFMMGIGGVLTFKNADLREVLPHINPENLLLETDAPYLTPSPYRGKRNEPAHLSYVLEYMSRALDMSQETIATVTSQNARRLFLPPTK